MLPSFRTLEARGYGVSAFEYEAVLVRQTASSAGMVLFGAPASHISMWGGIPEKRQLGADFGQAETTGFQRELNKRRLDDLVAFYNEPANVIQNPLLCAAREGPGGSVEFAPHGDGEGFLVPGSMTIVEGNLAAKPLRDLFGMVRELLERRVPELGEREVDEFRLASLRQAAAHLTDREDPLATENTDESEAADAPVTDEGTDTADNVAAVIEDESHILDFWQEVAAREILLAELNDFRGDVFLGYSRDALLSFLRPVVVVDGQHRLVGALEAARRLLDEDDACRTEVESLIDQGATADEARNSVLESRERVLPVSLLLSDDPAEHVFQFVIVNQKATPIGAALLGTIVSTTLSNDELQGVSGRLSQARIPLEDSRAIASLTRDPASPFFNLVERGLATEGRHLLSWPVFGSLVHIFRDLQGGKLFGARNDYADNWRRLYLSESRLVADWAASGYESAYEMWRATAGPWRSVFIRFWQEVCDLFGNTTDDQANNYWGDPRTSNLFNKVSLTILAADFFQFLCERARTIDETSDVSALVEEWLRGVDRSYFSRYWNLSGVKKDSGGIRKRWANEWVEYRKVPNRLPNVGNYRNPLPA